MKRLLSILLSVAMVLGMMIFPVSAADAPTVTVETAAAEAKPGDTVTLAVTIADNPGFTNFEWLIVYDKTRLNLDAINVMDEDEESYICGESAVANPSNKERDFWGYITTMRTRNTKKNGTVFTLTFSVNADAQSGKAEVKIVSELFKGYFDEIETPIDATYVAGGVTVNAPVTHTCGNGTFVPGQAATCTAPGWNGYYACSCGKFYTDATCTTLIADLDAWKAGAGQIPAAHIFGDLIPAQPEIHTKDTLKGAVAAHYFCDVCDTYFTDKLVRTTLEELTGTAPVHTFGDWVKGAEKHWKECFCGLKAEENDHVYDNDTDALCDTCGYTRVITGEPTTGTPTTGGTTTGGSTTGGSTTGGSTTGGSTTGGSTTGGSTTGGSTTGGSTTGGSTTGGSTTGGSTTGGSTTGGSTTGGSTTGGSTTGGTTTTPEVVTYTVSFYANGGTGSMAPVTVDANTLFTLPANGFIAPLHKQFVAWSVNGTLYVPGDVITVTEDIVVTALWETPSNPTEAPNWQLILGMLYGQKFTITSSASEGGAISPAGVTKVQFAKSISYTITPEIGYKVKSVIVDGKDIGAVTAYTFKNVTKNHSIHAVFEAVNPYTDVKADDWFYKDVLFVSALGLMNGTGDGLFSPAVITNRAMVVTILWRMEGSPVVESTVTFDDVAKGQWYTDAINWAAANGIVNGYGNGKFGPEDAITREQIAAIFNRFADYKGWKLDTELPKDTEYKCSDWAKENVIWAEAAGLFDNLGIDVSDMTVKATRAELAAYLGRFYVKFAVEK